MTLPDCVQAENARLGSFRVGALTPERGPTFSYFDPANGNKLKLGDADSRYCDLLKQVRGGDGGGWIS
jgi:hypothetical protein